MPSFKRSKTFNDIFITREQQAKANSRINEAANKLLITLVKKASKALSIPEEKKYIEKYGKLPSQAEKSPF